MMNDAARTNPIEALACIRCGTRYRADHEIDSRGCPACLDAAPANLAVVYSADADRQRRWPLSSHLPGFHRFASFLPVRTEDIVTLGEGNTATVAANHLAAELGISGLFIKDESRNPTWSHKDRFSCVAVSHAKATGAKVLATASSGNAGASLAAYAARAGLPCIVATFDGAAGPMVEQIRRYGAMVLPLKDKNARWPLLAEGARRFGWFVTSPFAAPVVGSHPVGIEGYKTIAYETVEQFGRNIPEWFVVPVAYGDVIAGIGRGFQDLKQIGAIDRVPRMVVAEIYGSIDETLRRGGDRMASVGAPFQTRAISIGSLQSTFQALDAVRKSSGAAVAVRDEVLFEIQARLANRDGLFAELSSVVSVAAAASLRREGTIGTHDRVICLMTASGLKDLDQTTTTRAREPSLSGNLDEALRFLAERHDFNAS
jgi:threonine synthase